MSFSVLISDFANWELSLLESTSLPWSEQNVSLSSLQCTFLLLLSSQKGGYFVPLTPLELTGFLI